MRSIIYPYVGETAPHERISRRRRPFSDAYPAFLRELLPIRIVEAIRIEWEHGAFAALEEIRLRRETVSSLTADGGTVVLPVTLSGREMDETLTRICGGSLYAHSETIGEGYVILQEGVRVGVCGRAAVEGGRVIGVYDPSALSFRIPGDPPVDGERVVGLLRESAENGRGVLIYAPPGVGKTTLLRAVIRRMSGGEDPLRLAVVDSRGELSLSTIASERSGAERLREYTVDLLSGYPRPLGIEIAVRTLNAQVAVCDEIGGVDEAKAVLAVQNCGIPLLATAHGRDLSGLLRRPGLRMMHDAGIFAYYVGIARARGGFSYAVTAWEDANAALCGE